MECGIIGAKYFVVLSEQEYFIKNWRMKPCQIVIGQVFYVVIGTVSQIFSLQQRRVLTKLERVTTMGQTLRLHMCAS